MVDEPVDHRGGGHVVAEDLAPGAERLVAGDDHRRAFVAAGDEHEHEVRGLGVERDVADLVDDRAAGSTRAGRARRRGGPGVGVGEPGDPFGGGARTRRGDRPDTRGCRARSRGGSCRCRASGRRTTHVVDPLPERVRLMAAPGALRDVELEVLGWRIDDGESCLLPADRWQRGHESRRAGAISRGGGR